MQAQKSSSSGSASTQTIIVRCWQALDDSWRYTVELIGEHPPTRLGFASHEELLVFLRSCVPRAEHQAADEHSRRTDA